jgi:N-acetylneuraminic acid mutarotase
MFRSPTLTLRCVCVRVGVAVQSAERLQISINKWEPIADMTTIRSGGCAATGADDCFYVMGGYDGQTRLNTCEFYDPNTGQWSEGPQMVKRRSGADATTGPDGSIYVVGGTDGVMQHSSVERVRPVHCVPSLSPVAACQVQHH